MRILYDIGIRIYWLAARIISPWNPKARLWIRGRRNWKSRLESSSLIGGKVIWFHCASLGEFEQGRPVLEEMRRRFPGHRFLLTFFSPSGYEKRKGYPGADHVMYLPLDTARNARRMLRLLDLEMAVFIKYEFWYHFLKRLHRERVPLFLAAGIFRPGQLFFRDYGGWYRRFLRFFTHIFVQQPSSATMLESIGITSVTVAGDTRFDRVSQVARSEYHHPALDTFGQGRNVVVAGSTWERDEELLRHAFRELPRETGWIIAPHEIREDHLERLGRWFPEAVRFTRLGQEVPKDSRVVLIDTIGQLSFLYRFGKVAYIGGGFGRGIHNVLEAATYGLPVLFGPNFRKFAEAVELAGEGGAFPVKDQETVVSTLYSLFTDPALLEERSTIASRFVSRRVGATERIANHIGRIPRKQV